MKTAQRNRENKTKSGTNVTNKRVEALKSLPSPKKQRSTQKMMCGMNAQGEVTSHFHNGGPRIIASGEDAPVVRRITRSRQEANVLKGFKRDNIVVTPIGAVPGFALNRPIPINPGVRIVDMDPSIVDVIPFPLARATANAYDQYRFTKLEFHYIPEVGTLTDGQVILAWDADTLDPAPATFAECSRLANVTCPLYRNSTLMLPQSPWLFTREGREPSGADLKTYDFGSLFIGVDGTSFNSVVGRLTVSYELEFRHANINRLTEPANVGNRGLRNRSTAELSSPTTINTNTSGTMPLGEVVDEVNGLGVHGLGAPDNFLGCNIPGGVPYYLQWICNVASLGVNPGTTFQFLLGGNPVGSPWTVSTDNETVNMTALCDAQGALGDRLSLQVDATNTGLVLENVRTFVHALSPGISTFI
jgi:hypothetical protein